MKNWKKRMGILVTVVFLLNLFMLALPAQAPGNVQTAWAATEGFSAMTSQGTELNLGDYVEFGRYNDQPILWRVINTDSNGSMLFSEKILTLKAFDATGDSTDGRGDNYRLQYGSNYWEKANIREWLNSQLQTVNFSHQAPINDHVNYNEYANEAGFLYYFTDQERLVINPVTHKVLLSFADTSEKDGGTALHIRNDNISSAIQNYENAYYQNVTDKVFFLSVKELKQHIYDRGWEHRAYPTDQAAARSEYNSSDLAVYKYFEYWLRDSRADYSDSLRTVFTDGNGSLYNRFAYRGTIGVRPALYLIPEILAFTGNGTLADPYVIIGDGSYGVTGVQLNKEALELVAGAEELLAATLVPIFATNKNLLWTSSDESVAVVDAQGLVRAVAVGEAIITVTTEEGGYAATSTVTVRPLVPVTGVTLNNEELTLYLNSVQAEETLVATIYPEEATNQSITWTSSDESVATVDAAGTVQSVAVGESMITVTTDDGGYTATAMVEVKDLTAAGLYREDFEAGNDGYTVSGNNASWQWGVPTSGPGNAASWANVWATNLTGDYNNNEDSYLTSPELNINIGDVQKLTFSWNQWLATENNYDFASVEVRKDDSDSWQKVYGEVSGSVNTAWTGKSVELDPSYATGSFQVRFRLTSDSSVTSNGYYIDDVKITGYFLDSNVLVSVVEAQIAALPTVADLTLADKAAVLAARNLVDEALAQGVAAGDITNLAQLLAAEEKIAQLKLGDVYSFGSGSSGQLGHGDAVDRYTPTMIEGLTGVKAIATGLQHSLVLLENGEVYSFGAGGSGQLGHGDQEDRSTPTRIEGLTGVKAIGAGSDHSLVLLENGDVYSFGYDGTGQLGHGDGEYWKYAPARIEGLSGVKDIDTNGDHSLVLLENGEVYSFGGQHSTPTRIEGLTGVKDISTGGSHSLVLLENGDVYSFGYNWNGELGDENTYTDYRHTPARIESLTGVKAIAAGGGYSLVLLENGEVYSFGAGGSGQLGHGDQEDRSTPTRIEGLTGVKAIAAGSDHSHVLLENGDVYSFGAGGVGQLGHGDQEYGFTPTRIEGLTGVKAIAAGGYHSLVLSGEVEAGPYAVTGVLLNKVVLELLEGEQELLAATVVPINATNKNLIWTSSDENVAVVDAQGLVTAVAEGEAVIKVKTEDGDYMATSMLTVRPLVSVTGITLNKEKLTLYLNSLQVEETLVATIYPEEATNQNISWTSSNESVATVDQTGKVTAIMEGVTTIRAVAADNQAIAGESTVTVVSAATLVDDFNNDGVIDIIDMALLAQNYGLTASKQEFDDKFDLNSDGVIDLYDLVLLVRNITASTPNSAPVANAGLNQDVVTGSLVTLDGSVSSDENGDALTFSWSFTSKPSGSSATLSDSTAVNPSFTADLDGSYVLSLVVNDGMVDSAADTVTITAATVNPASDVKILFTSDQDGDFELYTMSPDGSDVTQLNFNSDKDSRGRFSPDGSTIAFIRNDSEAWLMDADGGNERFLLNGESLAFSPDGNFLAFTNSGHLYTYDLVTEQTALKVSASIYSGTNFNPDWSPDGEHIAYMNKFLYSYPYVRNIYSVNTSGTPAVVELTNYSDLNVAYADAPRWSPNGAEILYTLHGNNQYEFLAVMGPDGSGAQGVASSSSGGLISPVWSPDGSEIIVSLNGRLLVMKRDLQDSRSRWLSDQNSSNNYPLDWLRVN